MEFTIYIFLKGEPKKSSTTLFTVNKNVKWSMRINVARAKLMKNYVPFSDSPYFYSSSSANSTVQHDMGRTGVAELYNCTSNIFNAIIIFQPE